jgi:serine/threonine protein kinase
MESVGGFELQATIARTGRSSSARGHDPLVDRPVLVRLLDEGPDDAEARAFDAATRRAGALSHPALAVLLGGGVTPAGTRWAAFAHPGGTSLLRRVATVGRLSVPETLALGLALTSALAALEGAKLRHGAVRPESIALDDDGRPVVFDLLLGKPLEEPPRRAPEHDKPGVDGRADLFGLGVTLAYAATGALPGDLEALPAPLDGLVKVLLAPDPAGRYRSARAAAYELARALRDAPLRGPGAPDAEPTRAERAELLAADTGTINAGPAILAVFTARAAAAAEPARPAQRASGRHRTYYDLPAAPAPAAGAAAPAAAPAPAVKPAEATAEAAPPGRRNTFMWDNAAPDWGAILEKREYFFRYMASKTQQRFSHLGRPADEPLEAVIAAADSAARTSEDRVLLSDDGARAYRLLRELGRGGQGVVYEVEVVGDQHFTSFDHPVARAALKVSRNDEALLRERKAYEALQRPGVIKLLDRGSIQGRDQPHPYLVLERLYPHPFQLFGDGATRIPCDLATAVDTFVNLLDALHGLHYRREGGLVLCDVKPENIMLRTSNRDGTPSLGEYLRRIASGAYEPVFMDMGCAQDREKLRRDKGHLEDLIGTPLYLPPEALPYIDEEFVPGSYSDKTDVYALCLTFYEYLTGERPYAAKGLWSSTHGGQVLAELLALKASRESPIDPGAVEARTGADAHLFLELLQAGLHPDPDARKGALGLLERAKAAFKVKQRYVRQIGEYRYDQAKGVRLAQERYPAIHPVENVYVEARRKQESVEPDKKAKPLAAFDTIDL